MNLSKDEVTFEEVECCRCDTIMIWQDDVREWVCPECGNRAFQDHTCGVDELYFEYGPDDDYDDVYDEEPEEYYDPEDMDPDEDGF